MFWNKKYLIKIDQLEQDLHKFEQANEQVGAAYQALMKRSDKLIDQAVALKEENQSIKAGKEAAEYQVKELDLLLREQIAYVDRFHLWIGEWAKRMAPGISQLIEGYSVPGGRYPWETDESTGGIETMTTDIDGSPLLILNEENAKVILLLITESTKRTVGVLELEDKVLKFFDERQSHDNRH